MVTIFYLCTAKQQPWFDIAMGAFPKDQEVIVYDEEKPLRDQLAAADILVEHGGMKINREVVDMAPRVKFIQRYGTGMDHMDVEYVLSKGIVLANTPGQFSGVALAEHAMLLMLSLAKDVNAWEGEIAQMRYGTLPGSELAGKTLGLIGTGASGRELAKRAKAFGMRVIGLDVQQLSPALVKELGLDSFGGPESLDDLLARSDYVSIHVPLTARTRNMIGQREFELMKRTCRLVNVARGPIVNDLALVEALKSGRIAGAGLDMVSEEPIDPLNPLLSMRNVVFSPHNAGATIETAQRRSEVVRANILRVMKGERPLYEIGQPN